MRVASTIETARLDLNPLRTADADEMVGVLAEPVLYSFTGGTPPDLATLRARYEHLLRGWSSDGTEQWFNWIARLRATGEAIGFVQATARNATGVAEIAWLISVAWQGQGYATEAVSSLVGWLETAGAHEIVAHIHPDHAASAGVAARAGLMPTGELDPDGEQIWRRAKSE
jgi:RimJ/RimL family protein N-acetyltransferase